MCKKKWDRLWCEKSTYSSSKPIECSISHHRYKFHMVITCCLQGRTIPVLFEVNLSNSNFHDTVAKKEMTSTCCGSILFFVTILANADVRIDDNKVQEWRSQLCNNILLTRILRCTESLGRQITKKWPIKNVQHRDYGEHNRSHHNGR